MPAPATWLIAAVVAAQAWLFWPVASFSSLAEGLDPIGVAKLLPVAGLAALALAFHRLLTVLGTPQRAQWAAMACALPPVSLNALYLGRPDTVHIAACIMAVAMALERRHFAMFAWCGIALAFNTPAALVAPFLFALAIHRRVPIHQWLPAPAGWLVVTAPALLAEWQPAGLAAIDRAMLTDGAPNIWSLAGTIAPAYAPQLFALALATAFGAVATYIAQMQVARFDKAGLVAMAALSALLTAGLLPWMQEHHFLLATILTFAFAITRGTGSAFTLAALVQLGSIAAIIGNAGLGLPAVAIGALCMIAATWIAARPLIAPHANDNRDGSHGIPLPHGLRGTLTFDMIGARVARPRGE